MRVIDTGTGTVRQAPFPNGPTVRVLVDEDAGAGQLAAAQVTIPPGGTMPEHGHGQSTALVVPLDGELLIRSGDHEEKVTSGVAVLLDQGERVSLANETAQPVVLLAVFGPADFVRALGSWPVVAGRSDEDGV